MNMDYKYIEQLLDRYWRCETSLEEEDILRAFYCQKDIPEGIERYRSYFLSQTEDRHSSPLGEDFDKKILAATEGGDVVKAKTITLSQRLMPLFKAAAVVAIVITLCNAMQTPFSSEQQVETNLSQTPAAKNGATVAKADTLKADSSRAAKVADNAVLRK